MMPFNQIYVDLRKPDMPLSLQFALDYELNIIYDEMHSKHLSDDRISELRKRLEAIDEIIKQYHQEYKER